MCFIYVNFQLGASCRNCLLCFPLVAYHLILWVHHMMKVRMRLVLSRYIPMLKKLNSNGLSLLFHWFAVDDSELSLVLQIPSSWKPALEDLSTLQIFFDYYAMNQTFSKEVCLLVFFCGRVNALFELFKLVCYFVSVLLFVWFFLVPNRLNYLHYYGLVVFLFFSCREKYF